MSEQPGFRPMDEQPGTKAKQHDDEDAAGHMRFQGAEPDYRMDEQPSAVANQDDEDDTEGHRRA